MSVTFLNALERYCMHSELAYTRKGSGEPLVLIHGIGHRRQAWDPVFERLAESYDVIAVDLAGFGESAAYPKGVPYDMDTACENLADNFAVWGIERPHVVGNSLGGAISLELGSRNLASTVTALSPAGFFRGADKVFAFVTLILLKLTSYLPTRVVAFALRSEKGRQLIGRTLYERGDRIALDDFLGDAAALRNCTAFLRTLKAGSVYKFNQPVSVPTTVAWGTRDRVLLYGQSAIAQERLPDATHVALPNSGHVPMIDSPDLIIRVINQTVDKAA
jgi:pimeloyl-ACP methyl ester carboxylesterase